jgi:hypothetical protein
MDDGRVESENAHELMGMGKLKIEHRELRISKGSRGMFP